MYKGSEYPVSGQVRVLFKIISCYQSRSNLKRCKTLNVQFRRPASSLKVSGHREPARLDIISSEATSSKWMEIGTYSTDCCSARLSSARMTSSKQDAEVGSSVQYWWSWDWHGISLLCHQKEARLRLGCHWIPQSLAILEDSLCYKLVCLDSLLATKRRSFKCAHERQCQAQSQLYKSFLLSELRRTNFRFIRSIER